jgi:hypothetical protein
MVKLSCGIQCPPQKQLAGEAVKYATKFELTVSTAGTARRDPAHNGMFIHSGDAINATSNQRGLRVR